MKFFFKNNAKISLLMKAVVQNLFDVSEIFVFVSLVHRAQLGKIHLKHAFGLKKSKHVNELNNNVDSVCLFFLFVELILSNLLIRW